jgi:hypothetical protein
MGKNLSLLRNKSGAEPVLSEDRSTVQTWWEVGESAELRQGDLLYNVVLPVTVVLAGEAPPIPAQPRLSDLIVLSQSCDLKAGKLNAVMCAPVYSYERVVARGLKPNEIIKGRVHGYMFLAAPNYATETDVLLVDFRELFGIDFQMLLNYSRGARPRLISPYVEHLSQTFGMYVMRVGLPSPLLEIPKTKMTTGP